jgi:hypothetical protein
MRVAGDEPYEAEELLQEITRLRGDLARTRRRVRQLASSREYWKDRAYAAEHPQHPRRGAYRAWWASTAATRSAEASVRG